MNKANKIEAMAHGASDLLNHTTVLEMASSVSVDTSVFAVSQVGALSAAVDSPAPGAEMQYLVLMDFGDRRTVVAAQYLGTDEAHIWQRQIVKGAWRQSKWIPISTATPPQEYDLPLAAGYSDGNGCKYFKTQDSVVMVAGEIKHDAGGFPYNTTLATLPAGYRPAWCVTVPATSYGGNTYSAGLLILPDGAIRLTSDMPQLVTSIYFCAFFVAA